MEEVILEKDLEQVRKQMVIKDLFFKKDFIYLILDRGEGREKKRMRNIDVREKHHLATFRMFPRGSNSMCVDQESNWRPFDLRDDAQPTGQGMYFQSVG